MIRQLDLFGFELPGVPAAPWGGRSPRGLTRGANLIILRQEPQKDDRNRFDPNQYDLFRAAIPGRSRYGGAPSLLPLPQEER